MPIWKEMKKGKGSRRRSARKTLNYILKDKKTELLLTHNVVGDSIDEWVDQYQQQYNSWTTKHAKSEEVIHEMISWSSQENKAVLTREFFVDIAYKVISLRGAEGIYVFAVHKDKEHWHMHFAVSSSSILTNYALRLERGQFSEIRVQLEEWIKGQYPEIKHSFVYDRENKKENSLSRTDGDYRSKLNNREHRKNVIRELVKKALTTTPTFSRFRGQLKKVGLGELIRNKKLTGVVYSYKNTKGEHKKMKVRFSTIGLKEEYENFLEREEQQIELKQNPNQGQRGKSQGREVNQDKSIEWDQEI